MSWFLIIIIFFFGASMGSFIAASVYRMENKKSILRGRSECEKCGAKLGARDLIPIFSYLFLRGKCGKCAKRISVELFLTEIICGALFLAAYFYHSSSILLLLRDWVFLGALVFLFLYDKKYQLLPDAVSIPSIIIVFGLGYDMWNSGLAILAGGGFFAAQYLVSRGKWVGDGDIRMGALLGAGLGWPGVVAAIFIAYILGAVYSIFLLFVKNKNMQSRIAFGTFLAVGGVIVLFWGEQIIKWYLGL